MPMRPKSLNEVVELLRSLPPGTSMDAAAVAAWLTPLVSDSAHESPVSATEVQTDLTVQEVADAFGRGVSTIRTWVGEGRFPSAYRVHGREWRIPRSDVEAMQLAERERFRAQSKP